MAVETESKVPTGERYRKKFTERRPRGYLDDPAEWEWAGEIPPTGIISALKYDGSLWLNRCQYPRLDDCKDGDLSAKQVFQRLFDKCIEVLAHMDWSKYSDSGQIQLLCDALEYITYACRVANRKIMPTYAGSFERIPLKYKTLRALQRMIDIIAESLASGRHTQRVASSQIKLINLPDAPVVLHHGYRDSILAILQMGSVSPGTGEVDKVAQAPLMAMERGLANWARKDAVQTRPYDDRKLLIGKISTLPDAKRFDVLGRSSSADIIGSILSLRAALPLHSTKLTRDAVRACAFINEQSVEFLMEYVIRMTQCGLFPHHLFDEDESDPSTNTKTRALDWMRILDGAGTHDTHFILARTILWFAADSPIPIRYDEFMEHRRNYILRFKDDIPPTGTTNIVDRLHWVAVELLCAAHLLESIPVYQDSPTPIYKQKFDISMYDDLPFQRPGWTLDENIDDLDIINAANAAADSESVYERTLPNIINRRIAAKVPGLKDDVDALIASLEKGRSDAAQPVTPVAVDNKRKRPDGETAKKESKREPAAKRPKKNNNARGELGLPIQTFLEKSKREYKGETKEQQFHTVFSDMFLSDDKIGMLAFMKNNQSLKPSLDAIPFDIEYNYSEMLMRMIGYQVYDRATSADKTTLAKFEWDREIGPAPYFFAARKTIRDKLPPVLLLKDLTALRKALFEGVSSYSRFTPVILFSSILYQRYQCPQGELTVENSVDYATKYRNLVESIAMCIDYWTKDFEQFKPQRGDGGIEFDTAIGWFAKSIILATKPVSERNDILWPVGKKMETILSNIDSKEIVDMNTALWNQVINPLRLRSRGLIAVTMSMDLHIPDTFYMLAMCIHLIVCGIINDPQEIMQVLYKSKLAQNDKIKNSTPDTDKTWHESVRLFMKTCLTHGMNFMSAENNTVKLKAEESLVKSYRAAEGEEETPYTKLFNIPGTDMIITSNKTDETGKFVTYQTRLRGVMVPLSETKLQVMILNLLTSGSEVAIQAFGPVYDSQPSFDRALPASRLTVGIQVTNPFHDFMHGQDNYQIFVSLRKFDSKFRNSVIKKLVSIYKSSIPYVEEDNKLVIAIESFATAINTVRFPRKKKATVVSNKAPEDFNQAALDALAAADDVKRITTNRKRKETTSTDPATTEKKSKKAASKRRKTPLKTIQKTTTVSNEDLVFITRNANFGKAMSNRDVSYLPFRNPIGDKPDPLFNALVENDKLRSNKNDGIWSNFDSLGDEGSWMLFGYTWYPTTAGKDSPPGKFDKWYSANYDVPTVVDSTKRVIVISGAIRFVNVVMVGGESKVEIPDVFGTVGKKVLRKKKDIHAWSEIKFKKFPFPIEILVTETGEKKGPGGRPKALFPLSTWFKVTSLLDQSPDEHKFIDVITRDLNFTNGKLHDNFSSLVNYYLTEKTNKFIDDNGVVAKIANAIATPSPSSQPPPPAAVDDDEDEEDETPIKKKKHKKKKRKAVAASGDDDDDNRDTEHKDSDDDDTPARGGGGGGGVGLLVITPPPSSSSASASGVGGGAAAGGGGGGGRQRIIKPTPFEVKEITFRRAGGESKRSEVAGLLQLPVSPEEEELIISSIYVPIDIDDIVLPPFNELPSAAEQTADRWDKEFKSIDKYETKWLPWFERSTGDSKNWNRITKGHISLQYKPGYKIHSSGSISQADDNLTPPGLYPEFKFTGDIDKDQKGVGIPVAISFIRISVAGAKTTYDSKYVSDIYSGGGRPRLKMYNVDTAHNGAANFNIVSSINSRLLYASSDDKTRIAHVSCSWMNPYEQVDMPKYSTIDKQYSTIDKQKYSVSQSENTGRVEIGGDAKNVSGIFGVGHRRRGLEFSWKPLRGIMNGRYQLLQSSQLDERRALMIAFLSLLQQASDFSRGDILFSFVTLSDGTTSDIMDKALKSAQSGPKLGPQPNRPKWGINQGKGKKPAAVCLAGFKADGSIVMGFTVDASKHYVLLSNNKAVDLEHPVVTNIIKFSMRGDSKLDIVRRVFVMNGDPSSGIREDVVTFMYAAYRFARNYMENKESMRITSKSSGGKDPIKNIALKWFGMTDGLAIRPPRVGSKFRANVVLSILYSRMRLDYDVPSPLQFEEEEVAAGYSPLLAAAAAGVDPASP